MNPRPRTAAIACAVLLALGGVAYAFVNEAISMALEAATPYIFDNEGNSVGLESFAKGSFAGARALPQKTATYFIRVVASYEKSGKGLTKAERGANDPVEGVGEFSGVLDWGLVYGYR